MKIFLEEKAKPIISLTDLSNDIKLTFSEETKKNKGSNRSDSILIESLSSRPHKKEESHFSNRISQLVKNFEEEKSSKKISCGLMIKVNEYEITDRENFNKKLANDIENLGIKEKLIESSLEQQSVKLNQRLASRKIQSIVKKSANGSVINQKMNSTINELFSKISDNSMLENEKILGML